MKKQRIKPNGMSKRGNLKSIFKDGTKLFLLKDDNDYLITEQNNKELFWFLFNNWETIVMQYLQANQGKKVFEKTVNYYILDSKFNELKGNRRDIKNTMIIVFEERQKVLKIMNETLKIQHEKEAMNKTKIIDINSKK